MTDYHIREAAESLLGSVTSPQYPYRNYTNSHSVNIVTEDLVAGHRPQGRMSTVRRFFCLFVTFDLLFTSLMWLICVMLRGETLEQIFNREILHYDIKISLFDIVLLAVIRFSVLLLFYALLYINNWSVIALSTGGTCAFLIAKVFFFDWPDAAQPVYQVFLILASFTLSWGEAWFLDFRVLPQECRAQDIIDSIMQTVSQVLLILASFTLSWGEAWFLDFRVLPQEFRAQDIIDSIMQTVYQVFLILASFTLSWGEAWFLDFRTVSQVFLILASFTLSWGEAWFLDFRVLPQECRAQDIIDSISPQVWLILASFTLSWGEAWFLDFRVLPQECRAQDIIDSISKTYSSYIIYILML
ncbi:steroidogenic acute regulatory protein-like [Plutella xylostella]|uniref:steroidogenic acute regulatory protein-like n=1 Tax=Plutella xylostella TaxID=51655 RepID=UPI0020331451|nr:steroidogenic acute regulatory protein-like [Plutella xylostella]